MKRLKRSNNRSTMKSIFVESNIESFRLFCRHSIFHTSSLFLSALLELFISQRINSKDFPLKTLSRYDRYKKALKYIALKILPPFII